MKSFFPPALSCGDKVALTAPASPVSSETLRSAVDSLRFLGLEPIVMPSCRMSYGYLSGGDFRRACDINDAFASKEIKGVFCIRGGYGSARLLPLINSEIIKKNPKPFIGFSDITALHAAPTLFGPMVTFHGPMPCTAYRDLDDFTLSSLKFWLFSPGKEIQLKNPPDCPLRTELPGEAYGRLTGGNLSVLVSTLGSPYEIDTRKKILFIEDINEEPYKIDRALTALSLAGKFRDCSGIITGTFSGCGMCGSDNYPAAENIIKEIIGKYRKPFVSNLQAGHIPRQMTLPIGAFIRIKAPSVHTSAEISVL